MASPAIGIDFGTAYLRVAVLRNNTVELIPNEIQGVKTPIYLAYRESEQSNEIYAVFGEQAKDAVLENLSSTVFFLKRLIGRSCDEITDQIFQNRWPFKVENQSQLEVVIRGKKKKVSAVSVLATILQKAKEMATKYLNTEVNRMVITIPVNCGQLYKDETLEAARMAGYVEVDMIEETYAAALAYQVSERKEDLQQIQNVVVFHLGGGSFGVTVFDFCGNDITRVFNDGDPYLGGLNFDAAIVSWFRKKLGIHRRGTSSNEDDAFIAEACEKAKCNLASCNATAVNNVYTSQHGKQCASEGVKITRKDVEGIEDVQTLLKRIESIMCEAVQAASPIDKAVVILVGGSTRLPWIEDLVGRFGIKRNRVVNADEAAIIGAAVHAARNDHSSSRKVLSVGSSGEDVHDASNKDASRTCADELMLKNPAIEKDEQERRVKINDIEATLYKIKRYLQKQPKEQVTELLEKCEMFILWTPQNKIASTEEINKMDAQVQDLICLVRDRKEKIIKPAEPPKPQLQQNASSTPQLANNGNSVQKLPAHIQQSTGNARGQKCSDTRKLCDETEMLQNEIETLHKRNLQCLLSLDENLKRQSEIQKKILQSIIMPEPTLESQLKDLSKQYHQNDDQLKYLEALQRNIQKMRDDNYMHLVRLSHDHTNIVSHLQSCCHQFDELDYFCLCQHRLLREQQVTIKSRFADLETLLQANYPPP